MSRYQLEIEVKKALAALQPAMETDGGGVELVSVEEGIVIVRFRGACLHCPSIGLTLRYGLEKPLKDQFPWIKEVIRANR
jgi:Fe-S cluster biogenesis protein NfuA